MQIKIRPLGQGRRQAPARCSRSDRWGRCGGPSWRGSVEECAGTRTSCRGETLSDCIDCNACVAISPMGIDIREGQQMECVTCALCIDACDEVMARIGRPRGLTDYLALDDRPPVLPGEHAATRPMGSHAEPNVPHTIAAGIIPTPARRSAPPSVLNRPDIRDWMPTPVWQHIFRPRMVVYTPAWAAIRVALVVALIVRPEIEITVAPVRNPTCNPLGWFDPQRL